MVEWIDTMVENGFLKGISPRVFFRGEAVKKYCMLVVYSFTNNAVLAPYK
jgi:hypothetical protein